ncbi:aldo/keto reductase, partial [Pedococcus sp. 5OH_020]|uniref:aldo/keto reductase n=1 Tax=Pedococcus sp. 5OH_020 TaxID=2989814 RepID=UPI0022E9D991
DPADGPYSSGAPPITPKVHHWAGRSPACAQFGLSVVPYGRLHGGLLAGMEVLQRDIQGDMRFKGPGFTEAEQEVGRALEHLSQEWGLRPYQASLAWLLSRPAVASAIVGAETVEELTANVSAADVVLEPDQLSALSQLGAARNT